MQEKERAVNAWDREPETRTRRSRVRAEAACQVAGLYNSLISFIIENTADWTLEDGYRNIIASMGISFDGSMRNKMGELPERRLRRLLLQYVVEAELLVNPAYSRVSDLLDNPASGRYTLSDDTVMVFSSEPDVAFERDDTLLATIEIKGGIDPAGALERLGAAEKPAQAAIEVTSAARISSLPV